MTCLFSGEVADTDEHVIPTWLQKRMQLQNQTLYLPNGTKLPYKHAKVPAKDAHNNKFSQIENRISQGIFDPLEVYLWAFKIHLGLIYRDKTLRWDIRDPQSPNIFEERSFESDIFLFQTLYKVWAAGGKINPSPFGSVFIIDSLTPRNSFDLIHCLLTGTIAIDIGDKFILVLLWDQQFALQSNSIDMWNGFHVKNIEATPKGKERDSYAYLAKHAWAAEVAYFAHRHSRSFYTATSDNFVEGIATGRDRPLDFSDEEFDRIALNFGLEREKNNRSGEYGYQMRRSPPGRT